MTVTPCRRKFERPFPRNNFYSISVLDAHTGVQLDAGDTNEFFGCSFEGIRRATPSGLPAAAVRIQKASNNATGADNNGRRPRFRDAKNKASVRAIFNPSTSSLPRPQPLDCRKPNP